MNGHESFRLRYSMQMKADTDCAEIMIYGEICDSFWKWTEDDMSASDFNKLLKEAKDKGASKLHLRINSPGGDVYQAVAMRTMLLDCGMDVTVAVEGMCASAATLLACLPGVPVSMSAGSEYMIHNPRSFARGQAKDLEATAQRLRNSENEFITIYAQKSGQAEDTIRKWMDDETWMTAKTAKERGFVDNVPDEQPIVASVCDRTMEVMRAMYQHVPECVMQTHNDSNATEGKPSVTTENMKANKEEKTMSMSNMTPDQLKAENPALYNEIMQGGAERERERIEEIDALTPAGFEELAEQAKKNGTSALDYHKQIVSAQKQRGERFVAQRQKETAPAATVAGESAEEHTGRNEADEVKDFAKELASMAESMRTNEAVGSMY